MHKGIRYVLSVAAVTAVTVLGAATPSQAAPSYCNFTEAVCLFDGTGYTGARFNVSSLNPNGTCVSLVDHGWGDRVRSGWNTNGVPAALFANDDCIGGPYMIPANGGVSDTGSFRPQSVWVP